MLELPWHGQYSGNKGSFGYPKAMGPDVFFLSETHLNIVRVEKLMRKLKMDHVEVVESVGASGGLLRLWRNPLCARGDGQNQECY